MPPKGTYPDMRAEEIAEVLGQWSVTVTAEQFQRPTSELVENIYWACLTEVTGITRESLQQPIQESLQNSQREEDKHSYSPALTNQLRARLTSAAGIDGFSITDIVNPKSGRTITFLSAIINFVKYTDQECQGYVEDLQKSAEATLVDRDRITEELSVIQDKIRGMKAKIAEDEPKCEKMRQDSMVLRSKILAAKDMQVAALSNLEQLKSEKTALIRRKEILNNELDNANDSIMRTRARIVQSPDRIRRNISTMGATANDDKRTVALHEMKARDLQAKINALHIISRDIRGCIEQLQTIEKEVALLQTSQKETTVLKDHLEEKKIEQNELQLRRDRVRKQLSNAHEKLERVQRHVEEKRAANLRTSERLQQDYDEMVNARRGNDEQIEKLQQEADAIEVQKNEHLEANSQELSDLLDEYWRLRHLIDIYMETLSNGLPK